MWAGCLHLHYSQQGSGPQLKIGAKCHSGQQLHLQKDWGLQCATPYVSPQISDKPDTSVWAAESTFGIGGASQSSSDQQESSSDVDPSQPAPASGHPHVDLNGRSCTWGYPQGKHRALLGSQMHEFSHRQKLAKGTCSKRYQNTPACLSFPSPGWAAAVHLALLLLHAPFFADKFRQPSHLQNPTLQSHLPRSQPDLLPENEEKSVREQERRTETKGAETLQWLKNKHRRHPPVHPEKPPRSLISNVHDCMILGKFFTF